MVFIPIYQPIYGWFSIYSHGNHPHIIQQNHYKLPFSTAMLVKSPYSPIFDGFHPYILTHVFPLSTITNHIITMYQPYYFDQSLTIYGNLHLVISCQNRYPWWSTNLIKPLSAIILHIWWFSSLHLMVFIPIKSNFPYLCHPYIPYPIIPQNIPWYPIIYIWYTYIYIYIYIYI